MTVPHPLLCPLWWPGPCRPPRDARGDVQGQHRIQAASSIVAMAMVHCAGRGCTPPLTHPLPPQDQSIGEPQNTELPASGGAVPSAGGGVMGKHKHPDFQERGTRNGHGWLSSTSSTTRNSPQPHNDCSIPFLPQNTTVTGTTIPPDQALLRHPAPSLCSNPFIP